MTRDDLTELINGMRPMLHQFQAAIRARLDALDAKAKGLDGAQGDRGPKGETGRDGLPGVPGVPGADGKHGTDGLSPADLDVVFDAETRGLTVTLQRDGVVVASKTTTIHGLVLDRGVYKDGTAYAHGDGVTWRGSFWIAQEATAAMPDMAGAGARAWRLAVKAGRDGKDGKPGPEGKPGASGRAGQDLTQLGRDGQKW